MLFVLIMIMFERWTTFRTTLRARDRGLLTQNQSKIAMFLSSLLYLPVAFLSHEHIFLLMMAAFLQFISFKIVFLLVNKRRIQKASEDFCHLIDELIIQMKSGMSFRTSLKAISARQDWFLSFHLNLLQNAMTSGIYEQSCAPKELRESFYELFCCNSQSHNSISRLTALRHRLRVLSDFRRRSGQATVQIRAQALIMCGLYLATVVFMSRQFGFLQIADAVLVSGVLFTIGSIWMMKIGRNQKWKI